jgi:transcription antitermination factor NusG
MESFWLVARTKQCREKWAAENALRVGFAECYLPLFTKKVVRNGKVETKECVLFEGYLFVRSSNGQWQALLGTFGVISVLLHGERPVPVPEGAIQELKARENADGYIQLPERPRFSPQERVRIRRGLFAGQVGIYAGDAAESRIRVLLDFLGRKTEAVVAETQVEAA